LYYHLYACIITGSQEELAVQAVNEPEPIEESRSEEPDQELAADEEVAEDLEECPDHRPSSFERGKPQSISSSVCKMLYNS
jgi:hypothetical protein